MATWKQPCDMGIIAALKKLTSKMQLIIYSIRLA